MKLFLIIGLFSSAQALAADYQMYSCKSLKELSSCPTACKKIDITKSFKVHTERQTVIETANIYGVPATSILQGCTVIDEDNWVCRPHNGFEENSMHDAKYTFTYHLNDGASLNIHEFHCGKKKGFLDSLKNLNQ